MRTCARPGCDGIARHELEEAYDQHGMMLNDPVKIVVCRTHFLDATQPPPSLPVQSSYRSGLDCTYLACGPQFCDWPHCKRYLRVPNNAPPPVPSQIEQAEGDVLMMGIGDRLWIREGSDQPWRCFQPPMRPQQGVIMTKAGLQVDPSLVGPDRGE